MFFPAIGFLCTFLIPYLEDHILIAGMKKYSLSSKAINNLYFLLYILKFNLQLNILFSDSDYIYRINLLLHLNENNNLNCIEYFMEISILFFKRKENAGK